MKDLMSSLLAKRKANFHFFKQGCRANKGVKDAGKYYYEARPLESGMARIGWSTEDGSLDLGTDGNGFGYGADHDGFSIAGDRGKKMFNNEIENYGVVR